MRFDSSGGYVQRIDIDADENGLHLVAPVALAASDSIVYVADRVLDEIVRYQRQR